MYYNAGGEMFVDNSEGRRIKTIYRWTVASGPSLSNTIYSKKSFSNELN